MSNLFSEPCGRNVFRAGAAYIVIAWVIAQVFDLLADNFGAPDWVMKVVLSFLAVGFVVALLLSWIYELTPHGLKIRVSVVRHRRFPSIKVLSGPLQTGRLVLRHLLPEDGPSPEKKKAGEAPAFFLRQLC